MMVRGQVPRFATALAAWLLIACGLAAVLLPLLYPGMRPALRNSDLLVGVLLVGLGIHCLRNALRGPVGQSFGAAVVALVLAAWLGASPYLLHAPEGAPFTGSVLLGILAFLASAQLAAAGVKVGTGHEGLQV